MRQGQQNRRGRGRNRKSQNPLTRSFESNGPDVKIRGTPSHIAEKYVSLARDALSSGDRVLAENYLQHAEHYNRIIMAYREQQTQFEGQQGGAGRQRDNGDNDGSDGDDYDDVGDDGMNGHMEAMPRGHEPQPSILDGENGNANSGDRPKRRQNGHADNRGGNRGQDNRGEGRRRSAESGSGDAGGDSEKSAEGANGERRPRRRERYANRDDQPDFLRRPIRKPRRSAESDDAADKASSEDDGADGAVADNTSA